MLAEINNSRDAERRDWRGGMKSRISGDKINALRSAIRGWYLEKFADTNEREVQINNGMHI